MCQPHEHLCPVVSQNSAGSLYWETGSSTLHLLQGGLKSSLDSAGCLDSIFSDYNRRFDNLFYLDPKDTRAWRILRSRSILCKLSRLTVATTEAANYWSSQLLMANRILRSILNSSSYLYWHHWIKARHLKLLQLKTKLVEQRLDGLRFQNTFIMDILWFYELHNFPISLRRAHGAGEKFGELMQQCGSSHVPCGSGAALWVLPRWAGALACSGAGWTWLQPTKDRSCRPPALGTLQPPTTQTLQALSNIKVKSGTPTWLLLKYF